MAVEAFKYDIAFSLLDDDEPKARQVRRYMPEGLHSFLYTAHQKRVTFTDGVESFSEIFGRDSRCVVLLHRSAWGSTAWTRLEAEAIRSRLHRDGADFLTVVRLDGSQLAPWIPQRLIWAHYEKLGPKGLAAALIDRVANRGKAVRAESARELALRVDKERSQAEALARFLDSGQGAQAAMTLLEETIDALQLLGKDTGCQLFEHCKWAVEKGGCSLVFAVRDNYVNTATRFRLQLEQWKGLPPQMLLFPRDAEHLGSDEFQFSRVDEHCTWINSEGRQYSAADMAEHAIKILLERIRP